MVISKGSTVLITLAFIVTIIATDIYLPSLPEMTTFFKASPDALQFSIPLYMLGGVVSTPLCGIASDHFGRKSTMVWGFAVFVIGSFLCLSAFSLTTLLIGRFIQGIGSVVVPIVGWATIQDHYPREKGAKVMSWMGSIVSLGPLLAPSLGGFIDITLGWRGNFLFMFIFSLCLMVLMIIYLSEGSYSASKKSINSFEMIKSYSIILKNKKFLSYIILYSFLICGEMCYLTVIPFFFESSLHLTSDFIGIYISSVSAAYIVGTFLASRIVQNIGVDKSILVGISISLAGSIVLLLISFFHSLALRPILLAISLYMIGVALVWGPTTSGALQIFEERRGAASAVRSLITSFGLGLGGFFGSMLDDLNIQPLALFLVITCMISLIIFLTFVHKESNN